MSELMREIREAVRQQVAQRGGIVPGRVESVDDTDGTISASLGLQTTADGVTSLGTHQAFPTDNAYFLHLENGEAPKLLGWSPWDVGGAGSEVISVP